jgi:hypothetical protein
MNYKELINAELDGKTCRYVWHKVPNQTVSTGIWFDLSMSPGMPAPQYYASTPLKATVLSYSSDKGIYHGSDVSPATKYLKLTTCGTATSTATPLPMILLDYLMFYPFCDDGTTDEQFMDNTNALTRYTDGEGVQVMAISQGARTGGQYFYFTYTNQDGVGGRISKTVRENSATANGSTVTTNLAFPGACGAFIPLQDGDTGVRSIESVKMLDVDVGLFALVLVKPLAYTCIREITAPNETNYFTQKMVLPEIKPDAYLNWLVQPVGSISGAAIRGDLQVIWN